MRHGIASLQAGGTNHVGTIKRVLVRGAIRAVRVRGYSSIVDHEVGLGWGTLTTENLSLAGVLRQ
ncbi:MAG: hypothetical protein ACYC2K_09875 [Gemmatimonadales bacterium]